MGSNVPRWRRPISRVSQRVREEHMVRTSPDFDAVVIGAGFSGMYMLKGAARPARAQGTGVRGRRNCRRHLVLEPLSRSPVRFRGLRLLLYLGQRAAAGMGMVGAVPGAAGNPALSGTRCRPP